MSEHGREPESLDLPGEGRGIRDRMTEDELRDAGVAIDLPFEAPTSAPLRYENGKTLTDLHPELLEPDLGQRRGGGGRG